MGSDFSAHPVTDRGKRESKGRENCFAKVVEFEALLQVGDK